MIVRQAWFCPACQRHHAPHCDTCPAPAQARPFPGMVWPVTIPAIDTPTTGTPLPDFGRSISSGSITCISDPNTVLIN